MKIRTKIMLWFSGALITITIVTICMIFAIGFSVRKQDIKHNLITVVEHNIDEIEFFDYIKDAYPDGDGDDYISYQGGYLEIDDDFLDEVNGNYTALYYEDGTLIYGENTAGQATASLSFSHAQMRKVESGAEDYYVYDKRLETPELEGLWLRGVVAASTYTSQMNQIIRLSLWLLPSLLLIALIGGYLLAGKILKPIQYITATASDISEGSDLKKRIDIPKGNDEICELGETVNHMIGRLDKAFRSEKRFASDVSHELRTPVSVILAQCEYTLGQARSTEEYTEALTVIEAQTSKMNRMISQMLEFTRLETNTDYYKKEAVDLSELLTLSCMDFSHLYEQKLSVQTEIEKGISVLGNAELLTRLISNLLSNACKYGKQGGTVTASLVTEGDAARLCIADDGVGIPEAELGQIFERFYRGDRSRNTEGTGLGLTIAKEIAEFHHGALSVESEVGIGSRFFLVMKKI